MPIPYCDRHENGVVLDTDLGSPVIRFASYAPYRDYLSANGLKARRPKL